MTNIIHDKKIQKALVFAIFTLLTFQSIIGILNSPTVKSVDSNDGQAKGKNTPIVATSAEAAWWNDSWSYRKLVEINSTSITRTDSLFEVWVNFTSILFDELSVTGEVFDFNSIRIVEHDPDTGENIVHNASATKYPSSKYEVPYSTWLGHNYNPSSNAYIKVSWVLTGTTAPNTNRTYNIYFDVVSNGPKEEPDYWVGTSRTYTGQNEGYANNGYIVDTLYSIKSSNSTLFVAGQCAARGYYQATVARQRYKTGSEYRYDQYLMDNNQFRIASSVRTIDYTKITYKDNKIYVPDAVIGLGSGDTTMNLTYEVFENSIFAKVTFSFESVSGATGLEVRYEGDSDGPDYHVDGDGNSYQGARSPMGPYTTTKWTAGWGNTRTDLLGFVLNPGQTHTTYDWDQFYLTGYVDVPANGYAEMSFYLVSCPKDSPNTWQKVGDFWEDVVNTPKTYYMYPAIKKQASIHVSVVDRDGFPVPGATVYLNASADWSSWNDSQVTLEDGTCVFSNKLQGDYNLTVNLTSTSTNANITVNSTANINFPDVTNYITINASVWRIIFDVKDIESRPLTHGWISINQTDGTSTHIENVTINSTGQAVFRWENDSVTAYNYTVYYNESGYNQGDPIVLHTNEITQSSHTPGVSTEVSISTNMTYVNFTVMDQNHETIVGAQVQVFNSSDDTGPKVPLVNLTLTDTNGETQLYWRVPDYGLNYSIKVKSANLYPFLNQTDDGSYTNDYQNFTMVGTIDKDVLLQTDVTKYLGKILSVNDQFMYPYWNESLVIQAVYEHDPNSGSYSYAEPTWIRYTVKDAFQNQLGTGQADMNATTQLGRYEAQIDMVALGMVAGNTYSVTVEAFDAGYSEVSPITYYIEVQEIPTNISAEQQSFEARWGDVNSTNVQLDVHYDQSITLDYFVENATGFDLSQYLPLVQNNWTLKKVEMNFTNIVKNHAGTYRFHVYDDPPRLHEVGDSGDQNSPEYLLTFTGSWDDSDLDFYIGTQNVDQYNVSIRGYLQREGVVVNQSVHNVYGNNTAVRLDTPGKGWKVSRVILDVWGNDTVLPSLFNFTLPHGSTTYAINSLREVYSDMDYFVDPEVDYVEFSFHNNSQVKFNANFSILYTMVTDQHYYSENDVLEMAAYSYYNQYVGVQFTPDKTWDMDQYELLFDSFTNHSKEVQPSASNLHLVYNGQSFAIADGETNGSFSLVLTSPLQGPVFSFHLTPDGATEDYLYNLTIRRTTKWTNVWGLDGATVNYYVFSNSSINGETAPTGVCGQYLLTFDTSRLQDIKTEILKVSGTASNYATSTVDITLNMHRIYTRINGTTYFNRNRKIYKTEAHNFTIEYTDTYNLVGGNPQGVVGAIASFTVGYYSPADPNADDPVWTDSGTLIDIGNGLYVLDYDTEFLQEGYYKFAFSVRKSPDVYEQRTANLNLEVALIPTALTAQTDLTQTKIQREEAVFSFKLLDGRSGYSSAFPAGQTLIGVEFTSSSTFNESLLSWVNGTSDGVFNLTVDTKTIEPGTYTLQLTFTRTNYSSTTAVISLTVSKYEPTISIPTEVLSFVEQTTGTVTITISDALEGVAFDAIRISWSISGTSLSGVITDVSANGSYAIVFDTSKLAPDRNYNLNISVTVTVDGVQYTISDTSVVNIQVRYRDILGIPRPYFYMMVIGIAVIVSALAIYRYVAYARIPDIIKKIHRTTSEIKKGKTIGEQMITETPVDYIVSTFNEDWEELGLDLESILKGKKAVGGEGSGKGGKPKKEGTGGYA
ncbi:MAG: hypothetical protein ACTSU5_07795 [Promethearchaeota archaeon]